MLVRMLLLLRLLALSRQCAYAGQKRARLRTVGAPRWICSRLLLLLERRRRHACARLARSRLFEPVCFLAPLTLTVTVHVNETEAFRAAGRPAQMSCGDNWCPTALRCHSATQPGRRRASRPAVQQRRWPTSHADACHCCNQGSVCPLPVPRRPRCCAALSLASPDSTAQGRARGVPGTVWQEPR